MSIKLSSKLPDDDSTRNGLLGLSMDAIRDPERFSALVVGRLVVKEVMRDIELGRFVPTLRFYRIEAISGDHTERNMVESALDNAWRRRTGRDELPFGDGADDGE